MIMFMKNKRFISFVMAASVIFSTWCVNAEELPASGEKQIIYSEDFSESLTGWESNPDFYVLNRQLVFKNKDKDRQGSVMMSSTTIENGEIEFDLEVKDGNYFALIFRAEDKNTHYALRFYYKGNKELEN